MDKFEIATLTLLFLAWCLVAIALFTLQGCTTMSHEPLCKCDCKENSSYFECSGIHEYENLEIK
jgi:hypothetical protein